MITLHIAQYLADNGFGTLDTDLFYERTPLGKEGVCLISRSGVLTKRGGVQVQDFDFYVRDKSNLKGADKLEKIWQFLVDNYAACDLPEVPNKSTKVYKSAVIQPVGAIENLGLDENDSIVFRLAAQVTYKKEWSN